MLRRNVKLKPKWSRKPSRIRWSSALSPHILASKFPLQLGWGLRGSLADGFVFKGSLGILAPGHNLVMQGVTQMLCFRRLRWQERNRCCVGAQKMACLYSPVIYC